jgi:uncharacterized FlaG/YvyC family protein
MVRIIAELSVNLPTASSGDRYKYRYGYGGGGCDNRQQIIYRRPAPALGEKMSQKKSEKQPLLVIGETHDDDDDEHDTINLDYGGSNFIDNPIDKINTVVDINRNMHEMQQMREINEKSEKEKEKQKEKEEELKKAKEKGIDRKLGNIIYRSRTGELFEAQHSIHMTVVFVFDKKTGRSTQTHTQKVVWKDKVFETKQDWFSEMARQCAAKADDNMKIVRCD